MKRSKGSRRALRKGQYVKSLQSGGFYKVTGKWGLDHFPIIQGVEYGRANFNCDVTAAHGEFVVIDHETVVLKKLLGEWL